MTRRSPARKVEVPVAKHSWHPSPLPGQIVLVSSRNTQGEEHVAAKSWISMVASDPPTLSLACRITHRTAINILETREFVVNIPGDDISERALASGESLLTDGDGPHWTLAPALKVAAPIVQDCRAHIECVLDATRRINADEIVLYGRIVGVSLDESLLQGENEERYRRLKPLFFLEDGLYGVLDGARRFQR